ncbi:zinc transporter 9-like [Thrips palmi]|uniref:Proton-coupled zinc antiporter SLC30A9, mitochondrial n=1 Tax=Thrips palmi TaxID=161013 RepID=A0A6P9A0U1_THRPL|nr:zinc transporter 9-like [Thrips palmi]
MHPAAPSASSGTVKPAVRPSSLRVPSSRRPSRPASSTAAAKKRMRVDVATPSMERNFITVERAMADFLLSAEDLEGLKKTSRRSPYASAPEIEVLSRKDVVQRANQKWGSPENLGVELQKRIQHASRSASRIGIRRPPRHERRRLGEDGDMDKHPGLWGPSGVVVVTAIALNGGCLVLKLVAWKHTNSHTMFSEFLHSVADTANQVVIAIGVHTSTKRPSMQHPYGFSNSKFVSALVSGVGIFWLGMGMSLSHGVRGLLEPAAWEDLTWALVVMGVSGAMETTTLLLAVRTLRREAYKRSMPFLAFGGMTSQDPSVNVVLLEDLAAVVSILVASLCLLLSLQTRSNIPDAVGSLLVAVVLGAVALFMIFDSAGRLVGRSIPAAELQRINAELEGDVMVRAIHDVKGIDMGDNMVRYKAELDFDGRQLVRAYLDQVNMNHVHEAVRNIHSVEELEEFMLDHGENIVDLLGSQIDRIERKLKAAHPSIRHCDLEIL